MKKENSDQGGFYELKPYFILILGFLGILYSDAGDKMLFTLLSKLSGLILLFCALKIIK